MLSSPVPSVESSVEPRRLGFIASDIPWPSIGDVPSDLSGEPGGDRFDISIMALVALLFSSALLSDTGLSTFTLSAVTTGSAAFENVRDRIPGGNGETGGLSIEDEDALGLY